MIKPAIVVVGYNRTDSVNRLLKSIGNAKYDSNDVTLIISLDKAKNEADVVSEAEKFQWNYGKKIIRTFPTRQGLRKHIVQCGDLSKEYGAVIILEDDLMVSPGFYQYAVEAVNHYEKCPEVTGIALYSHEWNGYGRRNFEPLADQYDVYFGQYSITWGQMWTSTWWENFKVWYLAHEDKLEWNDRIPRGINTWSAQSWGKYFVNYIVETNRYYVIPRVSLSTNFSDSGEHVTIANNVHQVRLLMESKEGYKFPSFEEGQKYDIFFENIGMDKYLPQQYRHDDITVDLAGYGRKVQGRYLLTTQTLPYKIEKSYDLQLRPYEMNVVMNLPGHHIFLYDTTETAPKQGKNFVQVMRYEVRGFSIKDMAPYYWFMLKESIRAHLAGFKKKMKRR